MNEALWRDERDDRTLRYAGRRLNPKRRISLTASPSHVKRYDCQVALLTAANLLGRMTPSIVLSFEDAPLHSALPWKGRSLHDVILAQMRAADPYGRYAVSSVDPSDYRMHFGPTNSDSTVIHGSGWNTYVGPSPSPLPEDDDTNPFGPAFSAIIAASQLFVHDFNLPQLAFIANTLTWRAELVTNGPTVPKKALGDVWAIGAGSVGTAALYFLALANRPFRSTLIDMDRVKRWNLDRSPIFTEADVGKYKVDVASEFLRRSGISDVRSETAPLHEVTTWASRQPGTPDVVISAANEFDVRYHIEANCPPVQIYGTTGRNWQFSLIRHIPLIEACSCCLFPPEKPSAAMSCASAPVEAKNKEEQVDAALPFLSFGAGLMTAADILKLSLPGYPFTSNNVSVWTKDGPRLSGYRLPKKAGCICNERSQVVHRTMLGGGLYSTLSG